MKKKIHVTVYTWGDQILYRKIDEEDLRPRKGLKNIILGIISLMKSWLYPIKVKASQVFHRDKEI